ncbi:MAG: radical SAM protein [Candidatus Lokiarchaeota archaeon]|nr:radical SAM protein [Candidatus Lokiarchaeota archaeon]
MIEVSNLIINVNEKSNIPLFGLDFIGILDRGTNLLEVKPITLCNLRCKYCFVHAGDYINNFILKEKYIISWLKYALKYKSTKDIEIHIAPYGEFFLYDEYLRLIRDLKKIPQVKVISIQTNGTLLDKKKIMDLEKVGLTRLNISFNSLDQSIAQYLSDDPNYSVEKMLNIFEMVLKSSIDLLIAPIWFFGVNDNEIIKIIQLAKEYQRKGHSGDKFRLGIQNYLIYKTGRKLRKIRQRDFGYFYKRLADLEKKYNLKLKLGPKDFNIHPAHPITPPVERDEKIKVQIVSKGRTAKEWIGRFNEKWAVKVLSKISLKVGATVHANVIKRKTDENLITAWI